MLEKVLEQRNQNKKVKIGAIDGLNGDIVIHLKDSKNAREFLDRPEIVEKIATHGSDKIELTDKQYKEFSELVPDAVKDPYPGGSAYNTLAALAAIVDNLAITLVSILGIRKNGMAVRLKAKEQGIDLLPDDKVSKVIDIKTPVNYVLIFDNGEKIILKHPGTIRGFLKSNPDYLKKLQDDLVATIVDSDLFMLPGGATRKYDNYTFRLALNHIIHNDIPLIFTLPTHGEITKEEAELYLRAMSKAKIIMGNKDELKTTLNAIHEHYGVGERVDTKEEAMAALQIFVERRYKSSRSEFPITFMTDGEKDSHVVVKQAASSKSESIAIQPLPDPAKIATKLGAGDNTFAGFLAAILQKYSAKVAGQLSMFLGAAALLIEAAQLPHPKKIYNNGLTELSNPLPNPAAADLLRSGQKGPAASC